MKSHPAYEVKYRIYGRNEEGELWLLPEAEIKTGRNYVKTNSKGEVNIRQVPGTISYEVERKGYASCRGEFHLTGDTCIQDTLEYISFEVGVRVSDGYSGEFHVESEDRARVEEVFTRRGIPLSKP